MLIMKEKSVSLHIDFEKSILNSEYYVMYFTY